MGHGLGPWQALVVGGGFGLLLADCGLLLLSSFLIKIKPNKF
jgi:hypothetical protein